VFAWLRREKRYTLHMSGRSLGIAAFVAIAMMWGNGAAAQDGLRSASLPERPIATEPPGPDDLFRAGPDTYSPASPPRPLHPVILPGPVSSGGGSPWFYPSPPAPDTEKRERAGLRQRDSAAPQAGILYLLLSPLDAQLFIDGYYLGTIADSGVKGRALPVGTHRVELRAPGFDTHTFDIRIAAGESITYSRDLDRVRPLAAPAPLRPASGAGTIYVIPGCYAGNRPPSADVTARGCDPARLRTIPSASVSR
jgi:hypothetical protein